MLRFDRLVEEQVLPERVSCVGGVRASVKDCTLSLKDYNSWKIASKSTGLVQVGMPKSQNEGDQG